MPIEPETPAPAATPPPRERAALTRLLVLASASWVRLALTFLVGFLVTPILLRALGVDLFGLYMMIALTVTASDPIMAVINKACNRELTGAHTSGDHERMRRVFTNAVMLAAVASMITMIVPVALAALAPRIFNYDPVNDVRVRVAILSEGAAIMAMALTTPWTNLYWATQRVVAENAMRVVSRLLDLAAVLVALVLPFDTFLAYAVLRAGLQIGLYGARAVWIRHRTPQARFDFARRDWAMVRSMARTGGWAFGEFVGRFGFYDADHVLFNIFRGPVYNGINSIVNQVRGYTRLVGVSMLFGVESIAADLHERGRVETLRRVLTSTTAHSFGLVGFCCVISAAFFGPLIDCWLGGILRKDESLLAVMTYEQARNFAWLFLAVGLPGLMFGESHSGAANILYGMGRIRSYAPVVMTVSALRLIVVVVILAMGGPALSLAITTSAGLLVVYAVYFPWLISRTAETPVARFAWRAYVRPIASLVPVAGAAWWMSVSLAPWSLVKIALCCAALGALWAPLAFALVLDAGERDRVLHLAPKVLARFGLARARV